MERRYLPQPETNSCHCLSVTFSLLKCVLNSSRAYASPKPFIGAGRVLCARQIFLYRAKICRTPLIVLAHSMAYYRSIIDQLLFCAVISLQPYTLSLFPRANTVDASSRARA